MRSFIFLATLVVAISAEAEISNLEPNQQSFQTFNSFNDVKEREFSDSYGAPAAPVESSWGSTSGGSYDPGFSNDFGQGNYCVLFRPFSSIFNLFKVYFVKHLQNL